MVYLGVASSSQYSVTMTTSKGSTMHHSTCVARARPTHTAAAKGRSATWGWGVDVAGSSRSRSEGQANTHTLIMAEHRK